MISDSLEKISDYAKRENVDEELVKQKRQLGILFGLFALTILAGNRSEETDTHPAVVDRVQAFLNSLGDSKSEVAFAIAQLAFCALLIVNPDAPWPFAADTSAKR